MAISNEALSKGLSNASLHLVLLPTEACNFRCFYCYEDFRLARMEPAVVRGVKRLLERRAPSLEHLTLSWFGGEPLMARDLIVDLLEHARDLRRANPRLAFSSDITTNAWLLTRNVFEELLALGVTDYQVSFDGPEEVHDQRRVRSDGRKTFARIWRNVTALKDVPGNFEITVRVHVDRENQSSIPRFLDQCREAFGTDRRFKIFLRPLSRLGGPNDDRIAVLSDVDPTVIDESRSEAIRRGLALHERSPADAICHASMGNSFVVRADGRLSKCTVALALPSNDVGRIHEDGRLEIDAAKSRPWMRGLFSGDALQLMCPLMGLGNTEQRATRTA